MRIAWLPGPLLISSLSLCAQCPAGPEAIQGGHCTGDTLWVAGAANSARIDWYRDGQLVKTATGGYYPSPATIVAGGNGLGSAADQFWLPQQLYVDDKDSLYVADWANGRIQQFPPGSTSATAGTTVIQLVMNGGGQPWDLGPVEGVYLDPLHNIFTEQQSTIYKWTPGAKMPTQVATVSNDFGTAVGQLTQIYEDAADNVYVTEPGNSRVQKWTPGATSGVTVAGGNGPGAGANQLNDPAAACVDHAGNIYVSDPGNHRVQKWAPGAPNGVTVAGGNGAGSAANQVSYPAGLCVDAAGDLYVADPLNNRVQWWPPGATQGITVVGGNGMGSALNQLAEPGDVFLSADGWLYTLDDSNERVMKNLPTPSWSIDSTLVPQQPGVYTAVVTGPDGCSVTSEPLTVLATATVRLTVTADPDPVCSADSTVLTALADTTGVTFGYRWWVNGVQSPATGAVYLYRQPAQGAIINCAVDNTAVCVSGKLDSVGLTVKPSPAIDSGQVFTVQYGGSVSLSPQISGDIGTYTWSPATGLSDTTIQDPVAGPRSTTIYTLQVVASNGCTATGGVKVDVYTPLRLPNAFTPNGDGKNDVFYVLGGPPGLVVREMAVFDRWGRRVFEAHDVAAGDPSVGWTGQLGGNPLPAGTYVYILSMSLPGGTIQSVKGTVELIR